MRPKEYPYFGVYLMPYFYSLYAIISVKFGSLFKNPLTKGSECTISSWIGPKARILPWYKKATWVLKRVAAGMSWVTIIAVDLSRSCKDRINSTIRTVVIGS